MLPSTGATGIDGTPVAEHITSNEVGVLSTPDIHPRLGRTLHDIEVCLLDPSSWIPMWSTATGALEIVLGVVMVIVSLMAGVKEWMYGFCTARVVAKAKHYRQAAYNLNYALHGLSHLVRGVISMVPVLGNIALYVYDKNHRYKYPSEYVRTV